MNNSPTKRTIYDWGLEIISFMGLVASCIPLLYYNKMTSGFKFPIHYNIYGEPDGWGGRDFLLLFMIISVLLYLYLTLSERLYRKYIYPIKITQDNSLSLYRLAICLRRHVKLLVMLIFAYMNNAFLYNGVRANNVIMTWLILALMITMAVYYIRMRLLR